MATKNFHKSPSTFDLLALLVLLGVQWNVRTRCSTFAFFLVLAGLFAVAYMTLALSYGAVAANAV